MKRYLGLLLVLTCGGWLQQSASAQTTPADPVQRALEEELKRAMTLLTQKGNPAPYFLSYEVNESKTAEITASLGALQFSNLDKQRILDIEVRVGNYSFDNTHQIRGQRGGNDQQLSRPGSVLMPLDDDVDALKSVIWLETDRRYKSAVERMRSSATALKDSGTRTRAKGRHSLVRSASRSFPISFRSSTIPPQRKSVESI